MTRLAWAQHRRVEWTARSGRPPTVRFRRPKTSWSARLTGWRFAAPGQEPILSDWITIGEKPRTLPLMVQRPMRTVSGRVVDRQGKPVANIEVFQSGDGPERTTTQTDADGAVFPGRLSPGTRVSLRARRRVFDSRAGWSSRPRATVTVELTRTSERPAREMKMLADPIPLEESRALARRLVEPLWASGRP